jgi:hypothetical protein
MLYARMSGHVACPPNELSLWEFELEGFVEPLRLGKGPLPRVFTRVIDHEARLGSGGNLSG